MVVILSVAGDQQRHMDERLQVLEKQLTDLTEELARRSREQSRGSSQES